MVLLIIFSDIIQSEVVGKYLNFRYKNIKPNQSSLKYLFL